MKEWIEKDGALHREVRTRDFLGALELLNRIAPIAEAMKHHPDVELGWGYLRIHLSTHDAGTITEKDHRLAGEIEKLLHSA